MALIDDSTAGALAAAAADEAVVRTPTRVSWPLGFAFFVGGVAVLWLTLTALAPLLAVLRVALVVASLVLIFKGTDLLCKARWGRQFDTVFALSCAWVALLTAAAMLAGLLPLSEHRNVAAAIRTRPNQSPDLFSSHPLGTNGVGLDVLARCIYGARVSLLIAVVTVSVILVVGGLIGLVAGYFRGKIDSVVSVLTDTLLAIPPLVLLIALATVLGRPVTVVEAIVKMSIGLTIVGLPTMVRLSRANTLAFAQREFVLAARSMGAKRSRVLLAELMPNVAIPLLSYASIVAALFILAEGSLSFLGLGLAQPEPTWGNMIAEGQQPRVLRSAPFIALVPGVFMFLTIFAFNRIGEHFRGAHRG